MVVVVRPSTGQGAGLAVVSCRSLCGGGKTAQARKKGRVGKQMTENGRQCKTRQ